MCIARFSQHAFSPNKRATANVTPLELRPHLPAPHPLHLLHTIALHLLHAPPLHQLLLPPSLLHELLAATVLLELRWSAPPLLDHLLAATLLDRLPAPLLLDHLSPALLLDELLPSTVLLLDELSTTILTMWPLSSLPARTSKMEGTAPHMPTDTRPRCPWTCPPCATAVVE